MLVAFFQTTVGEVLQSVGKFLNVLFLAHALRRAVGHHISDDTTGLDDVESQFIGIALSSLGDKTYDQFTEGLKLGKRSFRDRQSIGIRSTDHLPKTDVML